MGYTDSYILNVMKREDQWLTFDELRMKMPANYDWVEFASKLEQLVEHGLVQFRLTKGMDTGYYRISKSAK